MSHKRNATRYKYKKQQAERLRILQMRIKIGKLMQSPEVQKKLEEHYKSYWEDMFSKFVNVKDIDFGESIVDRREYGY